MYCILLVDRLKKRLPLFINDFSLKITFLLFMIVATLSTFYYIIDTNSINFRNIIQYGFTFQYIILILNSFFERHKFENLIFKSVILYSFFIIALYLFFNLMYPEKMSYDTWAIGIVPGWPNSPPISLLVGLWIGLKRRFNIKWIPFIYLALLITESRIAILGAIIITLYSIRSQILKIKKELLFAGLFIILIITVTLYIFSDSKFINQILFFSDRIDIFKYTMNYISERPLLGYGGNSLYQISAINIGYDPVMPWSHTHNLILEIWLRYGLVALILFLIYLYLIYRQIGCNDDKFMFIFLLILSLFQIYIRDFTFLFYLSFFGRPPNNEHELINTNFTKTI